MAPKKAAKAKASEPAVEEKKRKAEETPADEPAKKEAKAEDLEQEKDAPVDKRTAVTESVGFNSSDTTLNAIPSLGGKVLMAVNEGGMQYLVAGARANVGIKAGRYMYEVKIIESLHIAESSQHRGKGPKQVLRVGFSAAGSSLILGDAENTVFFDTEGSFGTGKQRTRVGGKFNRDQTVSVLLNLDSSSPNANTVSLFRDGVRLGKPQNLPESLVGQPLFPHISFRNVSVQVNMGPAPLKKLPFTCRMLQGAAKADVVTAEEKVPNDGKYEVVFPVGFPDEGTFDWLDDFLEKNPSYVELSDRKLQEWAAASGLPKPKQGNFASHDKPSFTYQLPSMDDMSLQRVANSLAPLTPRNYVVMEVKSNLIAPERAVIMKRFASDKFKKVAHVVMGEPKEEYKKKVRARVLKAKQDKADAAWKIKKIAQDKKKEMIKRQKELAEKRKEMEEQRKQLLEEAKKKKAEEEGKKDEEEKKAEEKKEEEKAEAEEKKPEEETKAPEPMVEEEMEDLGDEPPKVELSDEEQKLWFLPKTGQSDVAPSVISRVFGNFTLPEKEEGFETIKFEWQQAAKSKEYLRKWVLETKLTSRVEDLVPSQYFREKWAAWQKQFAEWQAKQKAFKAGGANKQASKDAPADIFSVEDVNDIGGGEPLYAKFEPEDWALIQLRFELFQLQDAFKKDVNDPDRIGIPENHLTFYYNKYYKKQLNPKLFSLSENADLVKLVKDTVVISEDKQVLTSQLSDDVDSMDIFIKLTEESRKERQRRIDAGDETARLKFSPAAAVPVAATPAPAAQKGAKGGGKGGKKGKPWM